MDITSITADHPGVGRCHSRFCTIEGSMRRTRTPPSSDFGIVAGNGLVDRRIFLTTAAAAAPLGSGVAVPGAAIADGLAIEPWMKLPGSPFVGYGQPSRFEDKVVRVAANPANAPGTGAARTPLHRLNGTITPSGLHSASPGRAMDRSPRSKSLPTADKPGHRRRCSSRCCRSR